MFEPRPVILNLVDQDGERFTDRDLHGRPALVYFGFLHCRIVCPRSLAKIVEVFALLGPAAAALKAFYISVDPLRDTPEAMMAYLGERYPMITGLTGTEREVEAAKAVFRVFAKKAEGETADDYDMPHTAFIYLVDRNARIIRHFADITTARQIASDIEDAELLLG